MQLATMLIAAFPVPLPFLETQSTFLQIIALPNAELDILKISLLQTIPVRLAIIYASNAKFQPQIVQPAKVEITFNLTLLLAWLQPVQNDIFQMVLPILVPRAKTSVLHVLMRLLVILVPPLWQEVPFFF